MQDKDTGQTYISTSIGALDLACQFDSVRAWDSAGLMGGSNLLRYQGFGRSDENNLALWKPPINWDNQNSVDSIR